MISVCSFLFTLVLFSELSSHSVTVAIPSAKVEDGMTEQDGPLLGDEPLAEHAVIPRLYRRNFVLDNSVSDEDGIPKIIMVPDMRQKGHSIRGLFQAFTRGLPLLTDRSLGLAPAEYSSKIDRRNADLDMLRCMIGRVYRPCWEVTNLP